MMDSNARELARRIRNGQIGWEETFTHPIFGELTFKATLPKGDKLTAQTIEMDNLIAGMAPEASPRVVTIQWIAAVSSLRTLIDCPVVDEERSEDPDDPNNVKVTRIAYDPLDDPDSTFPMTVYSAFEKWRGDLLKPESLEALKNSFGETRGDDSEESSSEPTGSPSTTPA